MSRQLNPHLFRGEQDKKDERELGGRLSKMAFVGGEAPNSMVEARLEKIEAELLKRGGQTGDLERYLEKFRAQIAETLGAERARSEKLTMSVENLEQKYNYLLKESQSKMAALAARVNERKTTDIKIEELIDRQNSVIRGFEARLNQLQRLMAEKENQLAKTTAALNDAKMEIMRLKRLI